MAVTIPETTNVFIFNLHKDWIRIGGPNIPYKIDFGSNATVSSPEALTNIQVFIPGETALFGQLGIDPASGFTLSAGLTPGSVVRYKGSRIGEVEVGGSGVHNFHISFDMDPEDDTKGAVGPGLAGLLLQSLTYTYTGDGVVPDDFYSSVDVILSNGIWESKLCSVAIMKWRPDNGGVTGGDGGDGGGNVPPSIEGNLARATISDGSAPFSQVFVTDVNGDNITLTVGIGDPSRGMFLTSSLSNGTYNPTTGTYTVRGTPAQVQAALQKLVFVANPRFEGASPSIEPITFNIIASDGKGSTAVAITSDMWINRADVIKGKSTSEKLYGHSGKDKLFGNGGNDKLFGGAGSDSLNGGSGKDAFVFDTKPNTKTNRDTIADFKVKDDSFWLDNAVFTKLGKTGSEKKPALLKSSYFVKGAKAKDKNDYVIYDDKKGKLYYDADGSGSKYKQVEIATLSKKLAMTYKDFFVI